MSATDIIVGHERDLEHVQRSFGSEGSTTYFMNMFTNNISITNPYTVINKREAETTYTDGSAISYHANDARVNAPFEWRNWFAVGSPYTTMCWFQTDYYEAGSPPAGTQYVLGTQAGKDNTAFLYATGSFNVRTYGGSEAYGNAEICDGKWHHAAWGTDGADACFYIDGSAQNELPYPGAFNRYGSIAIGCRNLDSQEFSGCIFDVRIYADYLSADAIGSIYNERVPNMSSMFGSLIFWLRCDEGTGSIIPDSSGYAKDGSITAATWSNIGVDKTALGPWLPVEVSSPNNIFVETFDGSRFIDFDLDYYNMQTDSSDIVADNSTTLHGDSAEQATDILLKFDISRYVKGIMSGARLEMTTDNEIWYNLGTGGWSVFYVNAHEYSESDSLATINSYKNSTGLGVFTPCPWSYFGGQKETIDITDVCNVSFAAGCKYLVLGIRPADASVWAERLLWPPGFLRITDPTGTIGYNVVNLSDRLSTNNYPKLLFEMIMSGTNAELGGGSLFFGEGSFLKTKSIYLGSETINNIRIDLEGSTLEHLSLEMSPNGGNNRETCNSASITSFYPINEGSDLRLYMTASDDAILNKFSVTYVH